MAERPTPQSVAVCTLIALHSDPASVLYKNENGSVPGIEEHISKVISNIVLNNSNSSNSNANANTRTGNASSILGSVETMDLSSLMELISGSGPEYPYMHASKLLLNDLKTSCTSIDSFVDLFGAFKRLTIKSGGIDGDSAHGVYVRKRCLGFDQLGFDSVGRFWETCCAYVDEGGIGIFNDDHDESFKSEKISQHDEEWSDDFMHSSPNEESSSEWPLAPNQISRSLLQKCYELDEQTGNIPFDEMESLLQQILRENPELTLAHYLRFLNCSNQGERIGALEHFHRYFDYAMIQQRKDRLAMLPEISTTINNNGNGNNINGIGNNPNANSTNDAGAQSHRQRSGQNVVQYVSIVLASLFHHFGNDELAHMATEEAVRVAQQSGDGACLAYALGWLHATSGSNDDVHSDGGDGMQLLERASARAGAYDIRSLIAGASLQSAMHHVNGSGGMISDGSVLGRGASSGVYDPSHAWESVAAGSIEGTSALTMNAIGNKVYFNDVTTNLRNQNSRGIMGLFAQQNLVRAGLWRSLGRNNLALATDQVAMHCYSDRLRHDHATLIGTDIASSALNGTGIERRSYEKQNAPINTHSLCTRLDDLVKGDESNRRDMSNDSQSAKTLNDTIPNLYHVALDEMQKFQHSNIVNTHWYHNVLQLMHESAIRKRDYHVADSLSSALHSFVPITPQEGIIATIDSWGHSSMQFCLGAKWEAAKDIIIHRILPSCKQYRQHYLQCKYLLQLALIYLESSPGDPVSALPSILKCLVLSEEESIDPIHATALVLLSQVHFEMNSIEQARSMLNAVMPLIMQHGHIFFQGEAWLTLAKCSLSDVKQNEGDTSSTSKLHSCGPLRRSIKELEHSARAFEKIEDIHRLREIYYLQAKVFNSLPGCLEGRNRAAYKFRELHDASVSPIRPRWNDVLDHIHAQ